MRYAQGEDCMLTLSIPKQQEIEAIVEAAKEELRPFVQHIRWEFGQDWSGDWALFFRIVLPDTVVRGRQRHRITEQVRRHLIERVRPQERGLLAYFSFRGQSEQAALREEAWM
jgi:hypothetical protein